MRESIFLSPFCYLRNSVPEVWDLSMPLGECLLQARGGSPELARHTTHGPPHCGLRPHRPPYLSSLLRAVTAPLRF